MRRLLAATRGLRRGSGDGAAPAFGSAFSSPSLSTQDSSSSLSMDGSAVSRRFFRVADDADLGAPNVSWNVFTSIVHVGPPSEPVPSSISSMDLASSTSPGASVCREFFRARGMVGLACACFC